MLKLELEILKIVLPETKCKRFVFKNCTSYGTNELFLVEGTFLSPRIREPHKL